MPFLLDPTDLPGLAERLAHLGVLLRGARLEGATRAGEGNMNLVLRVTRQGGETLIVKQARPWVEKYPTIAAPVERATVEAAFYAAVRRLPDVRTRMPRLLAYDPDAHLLVLEDLGAGADLLDLYAGARLSEADLDVLLTWLATLHAHGADELDAALRGVLANRAMRALNHAHVFDLPFRDTPPRPLDEVLPGLASLHGELVADGVLRRAAASLGARYLADGDALVHGDFYPGSFLRTPRGLRMLDPEFAALADPAWDYGVLAGHLLLAGQDTAAVERVLAAGGPAARGYAGVEVLRRLVGVAQLPLSLDLAARAALAWRAAAWLREASP